jgi:restriction endonuclease Mrr
VKKKIDMSELFAFIKRSLDIRERHHYREVLYAAVKERHFSNNKHPDIDEIVDSRIKTFKTMINKHISDYNRFRRPLRFYWSPDDPEFLVGSAYILPEDDAQQLETKRKIGIAFLLEEILINMDSDLFESLCILILKELGCQITGATRVTGDGGIDCYGTLQVDQVENNMLLKGLEVLPGARIHVIGQAKRYSDIQPIRTPHIREFLGSALLLEFSQGWNIQKELAIQNLPPKYLRPRDPIILLFFTTSHATRNARVLADCLGIHLQDGEDIARWLAFNRLDHCSQDSVQLRQELKTWIDSTT